ncbi:MAG: SUMF1/EgtB/PvdO family nonheme iron enzyme [Planctomycetaceae bacterium]
MAESSNADRAAPSATRQPRGGDAAADVTPPMFHPNAADDAFVAGGGLSETIQSVPSRSSSAGPATPVTPVVAESGPDDGSPPRSLDRLGHYEIVGWLGGGGMAEVFQGYERALDRHVALKVLSPALARDGDFVRRFHREAAAAARLVHPHVVKIFFIGEDRGRHFYAMQFVRGESLAERLKRREPTIDESLAFVEQLLSGLAAAHRLGLVHRDIKPGNLLIDAVQDRLLLSDFGLVKVSDASEAVTKTGVVLGTADYMAPEQGKGGPIDARADLYSVGVLMYRLLGGRLPFPADSPAAALFKHAYEIPPPLCEFRPEVPEHLSDLVDRLLAKSPSERPASAEHLLAEVRAVRRRPGRGDGASEGGGFAERQRSVVIPAPVFEEPDGDDAAPLDASRLERRREALALLATTFRLHGPAFARSLRSREAENSAAIARLERRRRRIEQAGADAEAVVERLAAQVAAHRRSAAVASRRARAAGSPEDARRTADEQRREIRIADGIDEQVERQRLELGTMRRQLDGAAGTLRELEERRASLHRRLRAAERPALFGGRRRRWLVAAGAAAVAASIWLATGGIGAKHFGGGRSGNSAASPVEPPSIERPSPPPPAAATAGLIPLATRTTAAPLRFEPLDSAVTSLRFPAETLDLFSSSSDAPTRVWDIERGRERRRVGRDSPVAVAPSPRGDLVAVALGRGEISLRDVATGEQARHLPRFSILPSFDVCYSADGRFVAAANPHSLSLWNPDTARLAHELHPSRRDQFTCFAWSPDGTRIFAGTMDGYLHAWEAATAQAIGVLDVTGRNGSVAAVARRAHGRRCMTIQGSEIAVWNVETSAREVPLRDPPSEPRCVASSADGRFLFAGDEQGAIHVWSTLTGSRLHLFPSSDAAAVTHLAAAPNSRALAAGTIGRNIFLWNLDDIGPESFVNGIGMRLTVVPAGRWAGNARAASSPIDPKRAAPRVLNVPRPFLMGAYEVTREEFSRLMGRDPSRTRTGETAAGPESGDRETALFPVENVTWPEAAEFCNRLGELESLPPYYRISPPAESEESAGRAVVAVLGGPGYRLPTETEWEYACRAGSARRFPHGDDAESLADHAWFERDRTDAVGRRRPNAFGLYDMLGNVAELAHAEPPADSATATIDAAAPPTSEEIVVRGGAATDALEHCHPEARAVVHEPSSVPMAGFRVVRELPAPAENSGTTAVRRSEP